MNRSKIKQALFSCIRGRIVEILYAEYPKPLHYSIIKIELGKYKYHTTELIKAAYYLHEAGYAIFDEFSFVKSLEGEAIPIGNDLYLELARASMKLTVKGIQLFEGYIEDSTVQMTGRNL